MKKIHALTGLFLTSVLFLSQLAQAQIEIPMPSPPGSVYSKVGLTEFTIDYFRPKVRGRQVFGEGDEFLQPYGQIWRSGANSGSKLTLSKDTEIGGKSVAAGQYLIFTIPGKDEWTFMLYSDLSIGGNVANYDTEKEVMRTTVKPTKLANAVETLTFNIADISEDNTTASLELAWADVAIRVPIKVAFDTEVMASIKESTTVNPRNYVTAANYYLSQDRDLEQALEWMNLYLAIDGNSSQFWHLYTKAQILAKLGRDKEAKEVAEKSIALAKENASGDFGYVKRNQDLIESL